MGRIDLWRFLYGGIELKLIIAEKPSVLSGKLNDAPSGRLF